LGVVPVTAERGGNPIVRGFSVQERMKSFCRLLVPCLLIAAALAWVGCGDDDENGEGKIPALPDEPTRQKMGWTHYANTSSVTGVYPTPDGAELWCATRGGVVMFDTDMSVFGRKYMTAEGLPDSNVQGLVAEAPGVVWFYTEGGGVARFDGGKCKAYDTRDGLGSDHVSSGFHGPDGAMYFAHYDPAGGYSVFSDQSWRSFEGKRIGDLEAVAGRSIGTSGLYSTVIHRDARGDLWLGTYGAGLAHRQGQLWLTYSTEEGLPSNRILALAEGRGGTIVCATTEGLAEWRRAEKRWIPIEGAPKEVAEGPVYALGFDDRNRLWCGVEHAVWRRDKGGRWTRLPAEGGLDGGPVRTIVFDGDVVWLGLDRAGGLWRYDGAEFKRFVSPSPISGDDVVAIAPGPGGVVWFGTAHGGLDVYAGDGWRHFGPPDFPTPNIRDLAYDGAAVLAATDAGLGRYENNEWKFFGREIPDQNVRVLLKASDRALWIGTAFAGAGRYDGVNWTFYGAKDLGSDNVTAIAEGQRGQVWFGTDSGLALKDGDKWTRWKASDEGLPADFVRALAVDGKGRVWMGTARGLARYEPKTNSWQRWRAERGKLLSDMVNDIYCAPDGSVWIATDQGASKLYHDQWWSVRGTDGLVSNRVRVIVPDPAGNGLWFGTAAGASHLKL
jgi:ligand-binding sensor domain-containing protein